jgi:hypothetical protein
MRDDARRGKVDAVRMSADLEAVLKDLEVEVFSKGKEKIFKCRSGRHPDNNPSASIRVELGSDKHGMVYCHSCQWATDIFGLVQKVKGIHFPEAVSYVERFKVGNIIDGEEDESSYGVLFDPALPEPCSYPKGVYSEIERDSVCFEYLLSRGFGWNEVDHYDLMDWRDDKRLFIPLWRKEVMISWVARSYVDARPKVLTPRRWIGQRWGMVGYDFIDWRHPVIHLSEGWASAFRVRQAGFRNSVALCGSKLRYEQVMDLAQARKFIVWREGDLAGENLLLDVVSWLGRGRDVCFVDMPEKKDPADFGSEELRDLFQRRTFRWGGSSRRN